MSTPLAVQLYSVRENCARDLAGTLQAIAAMGYDGVEFAGFHGHEATDVRQMLDDTGLKVAGAHIRLEQLEGEALAATVAFHQIIGNEFLIVPGLAPTYTATLDGWRLAAVALNDVAQALAPHNMRTGYHNHSHEFARLEGRVPLDLLLDQTSDEVVAQFDTGNGLAGGADMTGYVEKYPGRAVTVHLKEHARDGREVLIGQGDVDWAGFFDACERIGSTRWFIVEQETYPVPPMQAIEGCLKNLRAMGW